jgi:fructose 1,6-bisphosphatase
LYWIKRNFAYGIHSKKNLHNAYELNFVSYKKKKFWLEKGPDSIWRVFANMGDCKKMILKRIYLPIKGGSFWSPDIKYVELKGEMHGTAQEVRQRINTE